MHGCTIITRKSLPFARVLARSFLEHHPGGSFAALVLDDPGETVGRGEPFEVVRPAETGIDATLFGRIAFLHPPEEVALGMQPWLLGELLRRGTDDVVFLAPDCWVLGSLADLPERANGSPMLAAPLLRGVLADAGTSSDEEALRVLGVFDPGFLYASTEAAHPLARWRSIVSSHSVPAVDPRAIERLVASGDVAALEDQTYALSLLTLRDARVELTAGGFAVDRRSLRAFHFLNGETGAEGISPATLRELSARYAENAGLARLHSAYADALVAAGYEACQEFGYTFEFLPSGPRIDDRMRWLYWYALYEAEAGAEPPPDPFDSDRPLAFLEWLNEPAGFPGISRYLSRLLAERPDLRHAFPRIPGSDSARYLAWIRSEGKALVRLDPRLVPSDDVLAAAQARPTPPTSGLEQGLNMIGPFDCAHGLGEASRQVLTAVRDGGIPAAIALSNVGISRPDLVFEVDGLPRLRFDTNLLCVNVNEIVDFARENPSELFEGRYTIGFWWWEVSRLSEHLLQAFDIVDEVWVGSEFVRDALAAYTDKPVIAIPFAAEFPVIEPRPRRELGLPEEFVFLFVFDFYSRIQRKNPIGLVHAFREAFSPGDGASLVIKSVNGERELASLERLKYEARGRPDILVADGYMPAAVKDEWLASCDCYASLHRSEGFGLTIAEAMAFGKPAIATAYSGNMSFMNEANSYLVSYELTTVPENGSLYPGGAVWADPDLGHAARLMRHVFEHRDEALMLGARASDHVRTVLSLQRAGEVIGDRLDAIHAARSQPPL